MQEETTIQVETDFYQVSENRDLKYVFSNDDKLNLSEILAYNNQELSRLEDEKKAAASRYKSQMDAIAEQIASLSNKIRAGYEHRTVEVQVTFHRPAKNVKSCLRLDTGEAWVEDMVAKDHNLFNQYQEEKEKQTEEQSQQELPFDEIAQNAGWEVGQIPDSAHAADFDDLPQ